MENQILDTTICLLVTIVDRGKGTRAVDLYRHEHLHFNYICLGVGTASSAILDYFGLSETEKDIAITLAPRFKIPDLMHKISEKFQIRNPGHGILFTLPLSGVSSQVPQILCKTEYLCQGKEKKEECTMQATGSYDLVLTIVNRGYTDTVIDAARSAGARGGTVLNARRVGYEDAANLLGFTIQPEKEIIAILTPRCAKQEIMQAINKCAGLTTECHGILFSLPVENIMGLHDASGDITAEMI